MLKRIPVLADHIPSKQGLRLKEGIIKTIIGTIVVHSQTIFHQNKD